jgi:fructoselysine 6-kinase
MTIKVLGYGDNVVDRYVNKKIMYPGGNALNFSVNALENGAYSAYLGEFGNDMEGRFIQSTLESIGVDLSHSTMPLDARTEKANVEIKEGDRTFLSSERGTRRAIPLTESVLSYISDFSLIHSGCHAATERELPKLAPLSIIRSFDFSDPTKYRTSEYLQLVAPHIDFAVFSCSNDSEAEVGRLIHTCTELGVTYILLTRGADSPYFYVKDRKYKGKVKYLTEVKDTMGAGDAYCTAFMVQLLKTRWTKEEIPNNKQIEEAFEAAAEYSAKVCMLDGAFGYGTPY